VPKRAKVSPSPTMVARRGPSVNVTLGGDVPKISMRASSCTYPKPLRLMGLEMSTLERFGETSDFVNVLC
jgi:hypothetical protein